MEEKRNNVVSTYRHQSDFEYLLNTLLNIAKVHYLPETEIFNRLLLLLWIIILLLYIIIMKAFIKKKHKYNLLYTLLI